MKVLVLVILLISFLSHANESEKIYDAIKVCDSAQIDTELEKLNGDYSNHQNLLEFSLIQNCEHSNSILIHDTQLRSFLNIANEELIKIINEKTTSEIKASLYIYQSKDNVDFAKKLNVKEITDIELDYRSLGQIFSNISYDFDKPVDDFYNTRLIHLVTERMDMVKALLHWGVDLNLTDGYAKNAVYYAIENDQIEVMKLLISKGAIYEYYETCGDGCVYAWAWSAIYTAVEKENVELVKYFIELGANVSIRQQLNGGRDKTPLHLTALNDNVEIAELLVEAGADINAKTERWCSSGNCDGTAQTPYFMTFYRDSSKVAAFLIDAGANLDVSDYTSSPFHYVIKEDSREMMKLFIQRDMYLNEENLLRKVVSNGDMEIFELLVTKGLPLENVLVYASNYGQVDMVRRLIELKAPFKDKALYSVSYSQNRRDYKEIISLLLDYGANVNYVVKGIDSTLFNAFQWEYDYFLKFLNLGANINLKEDNGDTFFHQLFYCIADHRVGDSYYDGWKCKTRRDRRSPFSYYGHYSYVDRIEAFIQNGADLKAKDSEGLTAIDWMKKLKRRNCKKFHDPLMYHQAWYIESCLKMKEKMKKLYKKYR